MVRGNNILRNIIWIILACSAFVPILINAQTIYPFITAKVSIFRFLTVVTFVLFLWLLFSENKKVAAIFDLRKNKILGAWLLLLGAFILSAIFGVDAYNSFWSGNERMIGIISWISFLLFYVSLVFIFSIDKNKERIFKYLVLTGAWVVSVSAVLGYYGGFLLESFRGGRLTGLAGNPSYLAVYMLFAAFLALSLAFEHYEKNNNGSFVFWLLGFLYFSVILFGTGTRGAMIGWAVGTFGVLLYLIFKYRQNWIGKLSLIIVIAGMISVGSLFILKNTTFVKNNLALSRLTSISVSDTTAQSRLFSSMTAIKAWPAKPIFGWGLENYKQAFLHNFIPEMVNNNPDDVTFDKAHNMPLEILITTGIIGLAAYLYLFYAAFRSLKEKVTKNEMGSTVAVVLGFGFLGYCISNLFLFDVFESLFMMTIFLVLFTTHLSFTSTSSGFTSILRKNITFTFLIIISAIAVVAIYIGVLLPYNTIYNFSKAKNFLLAKKPDLSYTYLQKAFSYETLSMRDDTWAFLQTYILERNNLGDSDKLRFDSLLKTNLKVLIKRHPTFRDLQDNLVYLLINRPGAYVNDIGEAKSLAIGLVQYAPNYLNYRTNLAFIYGLDKDYDKAINEVNYVLNITDQLNRPYWYKGIILNMKGDKTEALDNFAIAVKKGYEPSVDELFVLTQQAIDAKSYDYLVIFYIKAIQLDSKSIQNYASLAAAYKEIGDYNNARKTAQKMLELDPALEPQVDAFLKTLPTK